MSRRTCQIFIAQRGGYSYEDIAVAFAVKPRTVEKHVASQSLQLRELMPDSRAFVPAAGRRHPLKQGGMARVVGTNAEKATTSGSGTSSVTGSFGRRPRHLEVTFGQPLERLGRQRETPRVGPGDLCGTPAPWRRPPGTDGRTRAI